MRVRCRLADYRGRRSLRQLEAASGINRGTLSLIEAGRLLPLDRQIPALEQAYGHPFEDWFGDGTYSRLMLAALVPDPEEAAA